jgi:hypothetical protein
MPQDHEKEQGKEAHPRASIEAVSELRLLLTWEVRYSYIHSKKCANLNFDWTDEEFAGGGTFYEVHVTSSPDIGEGSTEDRSAGDEAWPLARLDLYISQLQVMRMHTFLQQAYPAPPVGKK